MPEMTPPNPNSQDLPEIDALLHQAARTAAAPIGLADRVYDASVVHLGERTPLVETSPVVGVIGRRSTWARLALAACVAVACVVVFQVSQSPPVSPPGGSMLATAEPTDAIEIDETEILESLATLGHQDLYASASTQDISDVTGHLEDTFHMQSFDGVLAEMNLIASSF